MAVDAEKNPLSHWHMHLHFATAPVVLPEIAIPKSAAKIRSFPSDARPYQLLMHINSSYLQQLLQLSFRHLVSTFCSLLKRILASSARMWRPELSQLSCRNNHCAMSPEEPSMCLGIEYLLVLSLLSKMGRIPWSAPLQLPSPRFVHHHVPPPMARKKHGFYLSAKKTFHPMAHHHFPMVHQMG